MCGAEIINSNFYRPNRFLSEREQMQGAMAASSAACSVQRCVLCEELNPDSLLTSVP